MSPSPTTARRGWLDSDAFYGDAMTQFSHLARREDLLQRKRCRYLRKSTDLDHDKRTTESGCRSRSEFNRGPAMLGTSRAGHRPLSHRRTVLVRSQNRRTNWCNAMSTLDITDPSILSRPADLYADPLSDKGLQRADGCGRLVLSGSENGTRIEDVFERSPIRIMFPRTGSRPVEEAVLINTGGGIAGGDQLECSVAALPDASIAVTSQAAEKVYLALYEPARVVTRLKAEESAKLAWLPQETIVFNRARLHRTTEIDLFSGAELLALRRSADLGGQLSHHRRDLSPRYQEGLARELQGGCNTDLFRTLSRETTGFFARDYSFPGMQLCSDVGKRTDRRPLCRGRVF